jgi:hypothetical protein
MMPPLTHAAAPEDQKLSAPEFTVQFVDHSYDVSPVYGTDPYTGQTTIQQQGYHVKNVTVDFKIKNQPFTPYKDKDGNDVNLYYAIRAKGHFGESWSNVIFPPSGEFASTKIQASALEYTEIAYAYQESSWNIPAGGQVDFQVQALAGYSYVIWNHEHIQSIYEGTEFESYRASQWSSTQTLSFPANSIFAALTTFMAVIVAAAAAVIVAVVIVIVWIVRKNEKKSPPAR